MHWALTRGRLPILAFLFVLTAWFATRAARVDVEKNNESLNIQDPAQIESYTAFKRTFGSDEDLLLAVHDPDLISLPGVARIDSLSRRIAQLDGVRQVFSLTTVKQIVHGADGAEPVPLMQLPLTEEESLTRLRASLDRNPDFTGWLISADRRTAGITIEIEDRAQSGDYRARLIDSLRDLARENESAAISLHLTGVAVQKNDVTTYIERDRALLMPLALVTLAGLLALFFRRWLGVALPLAVTGISVAWTLGAYELAGLRVNAITALLPPVIMVLSVAVSVHLIQGWLQAETITHNLTRIKHVVRELVFPCFFCTLTTALGLGSLMIGDMPAVRQFGLFAALGVVVAFVAGMTLVPIGLTFLPPPESRFDTPQHRLLRRSLDWAADISTRRPLAILLSFTAVTMLAAAGVPLVRNNTDLVRFLKTTTPLYRDTLFIDQHLTGTGAIDFVLRRNDDAPLTTIDDVDRMARFEAAVRRHEPVTATTSIVAVLRQLQRGESGGDELVLPDNDRDIGYLFGLLEAAEDKSLIHKLVAPDFRSARISVRVRAIGTAIANPLFDSITSQGRTIFGEAYTLTPTGALYYVAKDSDRLVEDQVGSFSAGLLTVFLAIGFLFRAITPTVISIIPNVMPIIWTGGLMGALGIDLSTGTAMIASAVIGLVVDDTIHYLAHYYNAYRGDAAAAVRETTRGIGSALVVNNLILVLGFWVGCFGSFKPTIYFSLLSGLTMITAMLCDLFVTPACLVLLDRSGRAQTA